MNLEPSEELDQFRQEVRNFVVKSLPREMAERQKQGWPPTESDLRGWMSILSERGWSTPDWPAEYGGAGWQPIKSYIFEDVCAAADAPHVAWRAGVSLVGPVIYAFGSDEQKKRYLPRIQTGEDLWCQGFSEPGAGSDLASLRTIAVQDGEEYIVDGQKIWTSEAHFADYIFALVRTDNSAKPQRGISCLIIDMNSPGITVNPIQSIDNSHHINEVFFDSVRVPAENLVGEANKGWTYAKFLLGNERHSNALIQRIKREIDKLRSLADNPGYGAPLQKDFAFRRKLAQLEIETKALEWAVLRAACTHGTIGARDMAFASALKVVGSRLQQRVADLQREILGPFSMIEFEEPQSGSWIDKDYPAQSPSDTPGVLAKSLFRRAATIYGGSNEIQCGVIWRSLFEK